MAILGATMSVLCPCNCKLPYLIGTLSRFPTCVSRCPERSLRFLRRAGPAVQKVGGPQELIDGCTLWFLTVCGLTMAGLRQRALITR